MHRHTLLHLRVPFSFFLLPVFLFACATGAKHLQTWPGVIAFFAWHLLIYPASNGYNSYFDKDKGAIGGLEKPPPISRQLYFTSLIFDAIGIAIGLWISGQFALALFIYGLVSKAYSHPAIRLKRYPFLSLLTVSLFQGAFVFLTSLQAMTGFSWREIFTFKWILAAGLSSLMLAGSYPMTQIYQHEEDALRGDCTISLLLGIRGTFVYTLIVFLVATAGFFAFFYVYFSLQWAIGFVAALLPVMCFFLWWMWKAFASPEQANFRNAMRLNLISSLCLNAFYGALWWANAQI
ncbi:MAG: UbiA family prenyltransferase [Cytophagales bacterium]|nr:UbiA family prenyltransferase [Bernardetiaceae bacterium]MDW8211379.1 UbiA family prenyltransferase [Cytophagales bacterium]